MKTTPIFLWLAMSVAATPFASIAVAQEGPTTGEEMLSPFDPGYFVGQWEVEWTPPDTGLFPSDSYTGVETVTHINNRFFKVHVELEGEEGSRVVGDGMMFYEFSLGGQNIVRYMHYSAGFTTLQFGNVGGDLGGYYSHFWETPEFEFNDHTFTLLGRSYFVSPAAYRINQEISIDGANAFNFGTMWLSKRD